MIYNHPVAAASSPDLAWLDVSPSSGLFGTLCPDATSAGTLQPSVLHVSQQPLMRPTSGGGKGSSSMLIDQGKGNFSNTATELSVPSSTTYGPYASNSNGIIAPTPPSNNNLPLGIPELRFDMNANCGIGLESSVSSSVPTSPLDYDSFLGRYPVYMGSMTHSTSAVASGPPSMSGSASSRSSSPTSDHQVKQEETAYSFVDFAGASTTTSSPPLSSGPMSGDVKPGVGLLSTVASQGNMSAGSTGTTYGGVEAGLVPLEGSLSMGMDSFEGYIHGGEFKPSIIPSPSSQVQAWYQSAPWGSYISQGMDISSPSSFGLNSASPPLDHFAQGISESSPSASSPSRDPGTSVGGLSVYSPIPRQSLNTLRSSPPSLWGH